MAWVSPPSGSVAAVGAVTARAAARARRSGRVRAPRPRRRADASRAGEHERATCGQAADGLAAPCRAARRPPGGRWSVSRMRATRVANAVGAALDTALRVALAHALRPRRAAAPPRCRGSRPRGVGCRGPADPRRGRDALAGGLRAGRAGRDRRRLRRPRAGLRRGGDAGGIRVHQDLVTGERALAANAAAPGSRARCARCALGARAARRGAARAAAAAAIASTALDEVAGIDRRPRGIRRRRGRGRAVKHMSLAMNEVLGAWFDRVDVSLARQKSRVLIARVPATARSRPRSAGRGASGTTTSASRSSGTAGSSPAPGWTSARGSCSSSSATRCRMPRPPSTSRAAPASWPHGSRTPARAAGYGDRPLGRGRGIRSGDRGGQRPCRPHPGDAGRRA